MNGFLGNFNKLQKIFGQILKIKENILIGYQIKLNIKSNEDWY